MSKREYYSATVTYTMIPIAIRSCSVESLSRLRAEACMMTSFVYCVNVVGLVKNIVGEEY